MIAGTLILEDTPVQFSINGDTGTGTISIATPDGEIKTATCSGDQIAAMVYMGLHSHNHVPDGIHVIIHERIAQIMIDLGLYETHDAGEDASKYALLLP